MKIQANRHRSDYFFEVGDLVLVKLQPFQQLSLCDVACNKLNRRFFGPYHIVSLIGYVAYKLDLPPTTRVHPVFHISCPKSYMGRGTMRLTLPVFHHLLISVASELDPRIKISVSADISVIGFYGYIGYIGDISVDIFT